MQHIFFSKTSVPSSRLVTTMKEERLTVQIAKPRINSGAHRSNVTYCKIQATEQLHGQQCEGGKGMQKK